jgi:hypothetical protein
MKKLYTKIAGVSFDNRQEDIKKLQPGELIFMVPEENNKHDPNAIRLESLKGKHLGYLSRQLAEEVKVSMENGNRFIAEVIEVTGEDKDTLGCNISIDKMNIKNVLMDAPDKLRVLESKKLALRYKIEDIKRQMSKLEKAAYFKVKEEKTEEGKVKYTNEIMREHARDQELMFNQDYSKLSEDLNAYIKEEDFNKIEYDYQKEILRSFRHLCDLEAATLKAQEK